MDPHHIIRRNEDTEEPWASTAYFSTPAVSQKPDTDDVLNWSSAVLVTPKKSLSFSIVVLTIFTQFVNTTLANNFIGNYVSVVTVYMMFMTLVLWHLFLRALITRVFVDGMLAGSSFSRVAAQDEDWVGLVITWAVVTVTVTAMAGVFRVQAFHIFALVTFGAFPVLALLAIFTAVGLKGSE